MSQIPETPQHGGELQRELTSMLNRYSAESVSGTPDFILAYFMIETLKVYNETVSRRAEWRGELTDFRPGEMLSEAVRPEGEK